MSFPSLCACGCGHHLPPADVTREPTGGQELREALARDLATTLWPMLLERHHDRLRARADRILSLPTIAALLADADNWRRVTTGDPTEPEPLAMQARTLLLRVRELEATVGRVRELVVEWDTNGGWDLDYSARLRRALDGEPPCR